LDSVPYFIFDSITLGELCVACLLLNELVLRKLVRVG